MWRSARTGWTFSRSIVVESVTARAEPSAQNGKNSNADSIKQMQYSAVIDIRGCHREIPLASRASLAPDAPKASVMASRRVAASSGPSTAFDTWNGVGLR